MSKDLQADLPLQRSTWTRREVHDGSGGTWERAGGEKQRNVKRILDRGAGEFQSIGSFTVARSNMSIFPLLLDPFHTILSMNTIWLVMLLACAYLVLWLVFAGAWLAVSKSADCGVTFTTYRQAFYLALETITTIGYGVDDQYFNNCVEAAPVLVCGSLASILLDTALLGILVLRFGLSSRRTRTVVFTDMALLQVIDEEVFLTYRVFGMHHTPILQAFLQVYVVQHQFEGDELDVDIRALEVEVPDMDSTNGPVFLGLPLTITHKIDQNSPLAPPGLDRDPTAQELKKHFLEHPYLEVIACLGGTVEATGNTAEKRHSYTLDDIFWRREFVECISLDEDGVHHVDFVDFHKTRPMVQSAVTTAPSDATVEPPCGTDEAKEVDLQTI